METCSSCSRELKNGGLYLDAQERPVSDWHKAAWKTCPRCSELAPAHVFLKFPDEFGWRHDRNGNEYPQSDCTFHRNNDNDGAPRPAGDRRMCGGVTVRAPAARPPIVRRAAGVGTAPPEPPPEVALTPEQLDALVLALVGELELSEEGRKVLRTHLATERKAANRREILKIRSAAGPLTCDGCRVDLAKVYGKDHANVVELHHKQPLARGVQKPTGIDAFALLCPTCHRVIHYRREEPLEVEALRRILAATR